MRRSTIKRVRSLACASLSYMLKHGGRPGGAWPGWMSPPEKKLRALLQTLSPAALYTLILIANLGSRPFRHPVDLLDRYRWISDVIKPSEAIDYLMDMEKLGSYLAAGVQTAAWQRLNLNELLA